MREPAHLERSSQQSITQDLDRGSEFTLMRRHAAGVLTWARLLRDPTLRPDSLRRRVLSCQLAGVHSATFVSLFSRIRRDCDNRISCSTTGVCEWTCTNDVHVRKCLRALLPRQLTLPDPPTSKQSLVFVPQSTLLRHMEHNSNHDEY